MLVLVAIIFIVAGAATQQRNKDDEHTQATWYGGYSKNPTTPNALVTVAIVLAASVVGAAIAGFAIRGRRDVLTRESRFV